jgi:hypothetical protein
LDEGLKKPDHGIQINGHGILLCETAMRFYANRKSVVIVILSNRESGGKK